MEKKNKTASVTGATGIVGHRIVDRLLTDGYIVRVLSRKAPFHDPRAHLFKGGLDDEETLRTFITDADLLFHCAAELRDETKIREVPKIIKNYRKFNHKIFSFLWQGGCCRDNEHQRSQ